MFTVFLPAHTGCKTTLITNGPKKRGHVTADVDSLMAIATSTRTTIEFQGPNDSASFTLDSADKAGIQNMLLAYFALGADPRSLW